MSTYKQKYNKKYKHPFNEGHTLEQISKETGIKKSILQEVYNRGVGAWKQGSVSSIRLKSGKKSKTAPRSARMGKEQWAQARVYSFVMGGTTQRTADKDLWKKHKSGK